ncbi:MAG: hydrogenase expression/formation protein HypE [Desulfovibrionaceae bacterium]|nr:hydrogenase expression/formation protein HypE [Desulfovibrionaceae bacterium]
MQSTVLLAHGGGGAQTRDLIAQVFQNHLANPEFTQDDAAILKLGQEHIAFSTDGFIVQPYFFPGGDIGKLSICGTVNDLSCMGAQPKWLTCAFVLEEGLPLKDLDTIVASMAATAKEVGVNIVAGDTKVASKGQVDRIFITTSGIGQIITPNPPAGSLAQNNDAIIVTGDIGRHGAAILLAREQFGLEAEITSDCAPLWHLVRKLYAAQIDIHVIRDATRGGVGTVLYEIAAQSNVGIHIQQKAIPIEPQVQGICRILGLDPLYLACEGRLVLFVPQDKAQDTVELLQKEAHGQNAAIIGYVDAKQKAGTVVVETEIGAVTVLPQPTGELLPRIC